MPTSHVPPASIIEFVPLLQLFDFVLRLFSSFPQLRPVPLPNPRLSFKLSPVHCPRLTFPAPVVHFSSFPCCTFQFVPPQLRPAPYSTRIIQFCSFPRNPRLFTVPTSHVPQRDSNRNPKLETSWRTSSTSCTPAGGPARPAVHSWRTS